MQYIFADVLPQICQHAKNGSAMRAVCRAWRDAPNVLACELNANIIWAEGNFELAMWLTWGRRNILLHHEYRWPALAIQHGNIDALKFALFRNCILPAAPLEIAARANQWHIIKYLREAGYQWHGGELAEYLWPDISARLSHLDELIEQYNCNVEIFTPQLMTLVGKLANKGLFDWIHARTPAKTVLDISSLCDELRSKANVNSNVQKSELLGHILATCSLNNTKSIDGNLAALTVSIHCGSVFCAEIAAKNLINKNTDKPFLRNKTQNEYCDSLLRKAINSNAVDLVTPIADIVFSNHSNNKFLDRMGIVMSAIKSGNLLIVKLLQQYKPSIYKLYDCNISDMNMCIYKSLENNNLELADYFRSVGCNLSDYAVYKLARNPAVEWQSILFIKDNFPKVWDASMRKINAKILIIKKGPDNWNRVIYRYPKLAEEIAICGAKSKKIISDDFN